MKLKIIAVAAVLTSVVFVIIRAGATGQTIRGVDQLTHYYSSSSGAPAYENAVQVATGVRRISSLYAFNSSASTVYLKVQDSANSGSDSGPCVFVLPITATSFVNIGGGDGWKDLANGIYVAAFTDTTCTNAAGSVIFYSIDYR